MSIKSRRLSITLPASLYAWFGRRAKDRGVSIAAEVRRSLDQYMDERFKEGMKNFEERKRG